MLQAGRHSTRIRISATVGGNAWIQRHVSTASIERAIRSIASLTTNTRPVLATQRSPPTHPSPPTRPYSTRASRRKAHFLGVIHSNQIAIRAHAPDPASRTRHLAEDFRPTPEPRCTRTLHVGNLPHGTDARQVRKLFPAIERVRPFRRCADVVFASAAAAREVLLRHVDAPWTLWPSTLIVHRPVEGVCIHNTERKRAKPGAVVGGVALLYVYGFGEHTTRDDLVSLFTRYGPVLALRTSDECRWAEVAYRTDVVPVDRIVRGNFAQPLVVRGGIVTIERRTFTGESWVPIPADLDTRAPLGVEEEVSLDQIPEEIEKGERTGAQAHEDPDRQANLEERRNRGLEKKKMGNEEAAAATRRRAPRHTVKHVRRDWLMRLDDEDDEAGWQGRQDDTTGGEGDAKAKQARKTLKPLTERMGPP